MKKEKGKKLAPFSSFIFHFSFSIFNCSHPPTSARARPHPARCSSSAARALVSSLVQAQ
jgi:hypothetical protein